MEGFSLTTATTRNAANFRFFPPSFRCPKTCRFLPLHRKQHRKLLVLAAKYESDKLDSWDQMELKFGKLIGEDPELTMAKIMGRKANPGLSYLEIEKMYKKNKRTGKPIIEELPFDVNEFRRKPGKSLDAPNLVLELRREGLEFEKNDEMTVPKVTRPSQPVAEAPGTPTSSVPNVILRKPDRKDDVGTKGSLSISFKPNLSSNLGEEQSNGRFSSIILVNKPERFKKNIDVTPHKVKPRATTNTKDNRSRDYSDILLQKPEIKVVQADRDHNGSSSDTDDSKSREFTDVSLLQRPEIKVFQPDRDHKGSNSDVDDSTSRELTGVPLLRKPEMAVVYTDRDHKGSSSNIDDTDYQSRNLSLTEMENTSKINGDPDLDTGGISMSQDLEHNDDHLTGSEPPEQKGTEETFPSDMTHISYTRIDLPLLGRPKRLDEPVKEKTKNGGGIFVSPIFNDDAFRSEDLPATRQMKLLEDDDWKKARLRMETGERVEVVVISSSIRGFVVSFGSLIGYMPYRNLNNKWKYIAFESWLWKKGLNPSHYKQDLGIIGSSDDKNWTSFPNSGEETVEFEGEISPDMKFEDLFTLYNQAKEKYLASFLGQVIKVHVVLVDRESRKLEFSLRQKENEEAIERKKRLMAKLNVGDIVKCCIIKISYFGIFVEVEGVPALIHQSEVSWEATLDPMLVFKIGQVLEAKVHQLDFSLDRIFLSLKETTADPLRVDLEAIVGDPAISDGRLEAEPDNEWIEVELLIKELQQYEGIESVTRGRFFLSPGLVPTFQVYMASIFENQYKLLARAGNKVLEAIVQTSLSEEEMKSAIVSCTNRVQ